MRMGDAEIAREEILMSVAAARRNTLALNWLGASNRPDFRGRRVEDQNARIEDALHEAVQNQYITDVSVRIRPAALNLERKGTRL